MEKVRLPRVSGLGHMFLLNVFYFYMLSLGLPFSILDSNCGKEIKVFTN